MWLSILIISVLVFVLHELWVFLNWVWIQPRRMEKLLRKQGLKGNSYRFLFGDARETAVMYNESYSKPIAINEDLGPRVMPFIYKTLRTYGERSFMWVGPRPYVFITDDEMIKTVMNNYIVFQKPFKASNPIVKRQIGGLVRFEGEKWSNTRKKLRPHFHLEKLKNMVSTMQKYAEQFLAEFSRIVPEDGSSTVLDVYPYLPDYTATVVSNILFGISFDKSVKRTFGLIRELTFIANQAQPFNIRGEQYLPTRRYRRANAIENELTAIFTNMMNERLKKWERGEVRGEPNLYDIFLDELNQIDIKDKNARAMAIFDIIQQSKLFFLAGHETTSNLIAWTIVMLSIHHKWQSLAREEAFQVIGDEKKLTDDDLDRLKILHMILHEVLRLYPPVVELTRIVEEDTTLGDLNLPKGTMVQLLGIYLHRDPKIWGDDVLEFKPDRFAEGVLKAANGHAAFIPFGWGVRKCIGANMALREAKVFLSLFLRRFTFDLSPTYMHGPLVSLNMQPQYGIPLILRKLL
ncbi:cytochrome P450 CYP72A219-like [Sesamum indicum]|uniref:Cytochrome P450 CYP72A219-like n=1 Tax=Sesamum indicum TaxID=4182 RepID=A0A6I9U389_SESIN|nr:cytochrome P450 CYP72A219-like [Sesamum indicum]